MSEDTATAGAARRGSWWFGDTAEEDAEHRRALRDAARLAGRRERNYDQPWWAANVVALLDEVESLRTSVAQARDDGAAEERERIADACEDEARDYEATRQETTAYVVRRVVSEAYEHAARIARAQP